MITRLFGTAVDSGVQELQWYGRDWPHTKKKKFRMANGIDGLTYVSEVYQGSQYIKNVSSILGQTQLGLPNFLMPDYHLTITLICTKCQKYMNKSFYAFRSEGEKVRVGDDLILVSVATERYLVSQHDQHDLL